jgi:HlyD family secretion protein
MIKNHRKTNKRWIALAAVIVLAGAAVALYVSGWLPIGADSRAATPTVGNVQTSAEAVMGSYATVAKGNITKTVYGSGNLAAANTMTVYSGASGRVAEVFAEVGDAVGAGDVVISLSSDDIESEIATLESELFDQQVALSAVRDSGTTSSIYAPATGRVKRLKAAKGDDVEAVMKQNGYLCVISRDGKMKVEFEPASAVSVGDYVTVWIDGAGVSGRVGQVTGLQGKVAVTIDDDSYDVDKEVSITTPQGDKLGTGALEVNMPIPVTAIGGTVSTVYYAENEKITSGNRIFYLTGRTPSADLKKAYLSYQEARVALEKAQKQRDSLVLRAPFDGVVTELSAAVGAPLSENAAAFALQSSAEFKLVATVDELDIVGVQVGQRAAVTFDAYPDKRYDATVKRISGMGTVSGGVATYEVTLALDHSEGLLAGLTASADIAVADRQGVLVVPVEAVSTSGGKNYVTLASGETAPVETGVSDETNIEIVSGVSDGDRVRIVRSGSAASDSASFPSFAGGGIGGMAIPSGGMSGGAGRPDRP